MVALRSQQAANQATLAALAQRIDQSEHLLAQLGGRAPADARLPQIVLDDIKLPSEFPETLPSTLARRRPDILAAEADLHNASAQIGIATANLFPSLTLGAIGGSGHSAIADLLQAGTRYWSLQASLAASLFSGGSHWYTRRATFDAYDKSLALYEQTVLAALSQVADTLRALDNDSRALQAQLNSEAAAVEGLMLVRATSTTWTCWLPMRESRCLHIKDQPPGIGARV